MIRGDEWLAHPGCVGRPIGGTELQIRDPDGVESPRGGEKIAPAQVEQVLQAHPDVRSAVAFGVPNQEWGVVIGAVIDVGRTRLDADDIELWARERLGSRAPTLIRLVEFPVRDDAGKTNRRRWAASFSESVTAPDEA